MKELMMKDMMDILSGRKSMPVEFSQEGLGMEDVENALRAKFAELAPKGDYYTYEENKIKIFRLIAEDIDQALPKRVIDRVGMFCEVKTYKQGDKPKFLIKKGRKALRKFVTRVALGGRYERGTVDQDYITIDYFAVGGAVRVELEEYLDGVIDFMELRAIILDQIEEHLYIEIQKLLEATYDKLPSANKASFAGFDETEMGKLIDVVQAYGTGASILCTPEFARTIPYDTNDLVGVQEKRNKGYVGKWQGADIVVLPQSFEDETNTTKIFNPQLAFVVPSGGQANEKIIKMVLEGQLIMDEYRGATQSMNFQAYKKVGSATVYVNHIAMYRNTSL